MPKQQMWNNKIGFDNLGEKWKEIIQRIEWNLVFPSVTSLSKCQPVFPGSQQKPFQFKLF